MAQYSYPHLLRLALVLAYVAVCTGMMVKAIRTREKSGVKTRRMRVYTGVGAMAGAFGMALMTLADHGVIPGSMRSFAAVLAFAAPMAHSYRYAVNAHLMGTDGGPAIRLNPQQGFMMVLKGQFAMVVASGTLFLMTLLPTDSRGLVIALSIAIGLMVLSIPRLAGFASVTGLADLVYYGSTVALAGLSLLAFAASYPPLTGIAVIFAGGQAAYDGVCLLLAAMKWTGTQRFRFVAVGEHIIRLVFLVSLMVVLVTV